MMNTTSRKPLPYDTPAIYQIVIQGQIDLTLSDCTEDMICQVIVEADTPVTTLEVKMYDQADLLGVLNTLYEQHLTLILVKRLEI